MTASRFVDSHLGYLLGHADHALFKGFEPAVRAAGLTATEWRVLATLHDGAPRAVSSLAREVLSKQPTVTKLVQRMREQGWVALRTDPTDQRRTLVTITMRGQRIVEPLIEQAKNLEAPAVMSLDTTEIVALKRLLKKLAMPQ